MAEFNRLYSGHPNNNLSKPGADTSVLEGALLTQEKELSGESNRNIIQFEHNLRALWAAMSECGLADILRDHMTHGTTDPDRQDTPTVEPEGRRLNQTTRQM